jgi:hypothetical protein
MSLKDAIQDLDLQHKLFEEAEHLAGRPVEVQQTEDGKFIVLWMSFNNPPPPKGDCASDALEKFIQYMLNIKSTQVSLEPEDTNQEDTDEGRNRPVPKDNSDDSSPVVP